MLHDDGIPHRSTPDQVLLDDPLEDRRITSTIPGAVRVHDRDWPAFANSQAVSLGPKDASLVGESQLLETALEETPRCQASLFLTALRGCLIATQKDVTRCYVDPSGRRLATLAFGAPALKGGIGHHQEVRSLTNGVGTVG